MTVKWMEFAFYIDNVPYLSEINSPIKWYPKQNKRLKLGADSGNYKCHFHVGNVGKRNPEETFKKHYDSFTNSSIIFPSILTLDMTKKDNSYLEFAHHLCL